MTVKLPPSGGNRDLTKDNRRCLTPPVRVAAHDTVSGWCDFVVKSGILSGRPIDGYQIVLTDSHQAEKSVDALVISEKRHAV